MTSNLTLIDLNKAEVYLYWPVILFVALLMVVGTPGNLLVIIIYHRRFKRASNSHYFIEALAFFDLFACVMGMPTEIYDLCNPLNFRNEIVCKFFRFSETFTVIGSSMILGEVAIDRFWKVCKPHKKITIFHIKLMCGVAAFIGLFFSLPTVFIYGTYKVQLTDTVVGEDCSIEGEYRRTSWPRNYFIFLCSIFVILCILLTVLYILLYLSVRDRRRRNASRQFSSEQEQEKMAGQEMEFKANSLKRSQKEPQSPCPKSPKSPKNQKSPSFPMMRARVASLSGRMRMKISRTTVILFIVTIVFVVSYFPSLVVMICKTVMYRKVAKSGIHLKVVIKIFSKFYLINNACNPIIYSFLNPYFRNECIRLFSEIGCSKCCKVEPSGDSLSGSN